MEHCIVWFWKLGSEELKKYEETSNGIRVVIMDIRVLRIIWTEHKCLVAAKDWYTREAKTTWAIEKPDVGTHQIRAQMKKSSGGLALPVDEDAISRETIFLLDGEQHE